VQLVPLDGRYSPVWGTSYDLGHRGLFIHARSCELPDNALVVLRLYTELGPMRLLGRVVQRVDEVGVGCEFVDLDHQQRRLLSRIVARACAAPHPLRTLQ